MNKLGIIGGSGLYDIPGLEHVEEITVDTRYGRPRSPIVAGTLDDLEIAFLARHGRGHYLNPAEVPYRANISALRSLGVTHLLSLSAVGSLQEHLPPRTAVVPDQIIDMTRVRDRTFFEGGVVAHVGLADPFCNTFRDSIFPIASQSAPGAQNGGTYLCIEGPQFSTRAESMLYRSWQADVIGMTAMPEARLAREAGLCYATIAMVTDYDVWHASEEDVTVEAVQRVMADNVEVSREIIRKIALRELPSCQCGCRTAIDGAVITAPDAISSAGLEILHQFSSLAASN